MKGLGSPMLTRSTVAAILGVQISTVRCLEGRDLHPVRDANGIHHFDRREVEDLATKRGRSGRPAGRMAARVYELLRDRKSIGEIVYETELSPQEVRALFEQLTMPLGQRTSEEREAQGCLCSRRETPSVPTTTLAAMPDDPSIEHQLVTDGTLFEEIEILDTKIEPTVGNEDWHVRITFRVEEELVESCAFGIVFVLGLLSFHDGRPRGFSGEWFEDDDHFTAADMLRNLTFERGKLHLYVDYLRGRCVKTTVEVSSDGKVLLETVNRGQAATRWVDRLKGKNFLESVQ